MAKRAFCVGINDYPFENNDLRGCVNDARAWADMLTGHFDFTTSDVQLLTDADATKRQIFEGLKRLLKGAKAGDVLVFTNSSHGTYLLDQSSDEPSYDQAVCPYDIQDNLLLDDELRELFAGVPKNVHLVAILDNCHSGSGTRLPDDEETRRVRFLDPALRGDPVLAKDEAPPVSGERYPESGMKEVLLSGCTSEESSYDDRIGGVFHGAMTYYALKAIRDARHELTYADLHRRLGELLTGTPYQQHPQLEGRVDNKNRQIFA
jgi:metacaspase-1